MLQLLRVGEFWHPPGAPDMSHEGRLRRLAAQRAAVRYRNPETGRRHYCHDVRYRAAWARDIRAAHRALRTWSPSCK